MKNLIKKFGFVVLFVFVSLCIIGCNNGKDPVTGGGNTPTGGVDVPTGGGDVPTEDNPTGGEQQSAIKSLTAKEESVTIKIGESLLITNYYEITGYQALSAGQRACNYVSSNPEVVEVTAKKAEAIAPGTATITVTSKIDETKSCSFEVVVSKVFIDRELSMIPSDDDFSDEWNDETNTGSFRTSSGLTNYYYISGINSTVWYVETDITVHEVTFEDRWPKIGIVASARNSKDFETMVAFFLNASIGLNDKWENGNLIKGQDNNNWNEFGVCEVSQGGHWAWESGITNSLARHHDYCWNTGSKYITFDSTFKLGVARDGMNFHVYLNGNYAGSFQLSQDLEILYENGATLASHVGFYHFNCDATFANYYATSNADEVSAKVPSEPVYCGFLED